MTLEQRTYCIKVICIWIIIQKLLVACRLIWTAKKDDRSDDQVMTEMYPNTEEGDKLYEQHKASHYG